MGQLLGLQMILFSKTSGCCRKVSIEITGWVLQTHGGVELGRFDRSDTALVVSQRGDGSTSGCVRLLPTRHPYLLGGGFPQILNGQTSPEISNILRDVVHTGFARYRMDISTKTHA